MKYGSVCSGVEAATAAWHRLGWEPRWFSEIEKFPSAVLAHHYPNVPNLGDMTKFKEWPSDPIDVLVGGTPCQSFSVAGLRKGLDDPRGNLMLTYVAIAARYKPRWLVWENVPGVLSSNRGRDFGTFLTALAEIGYGFAYRICDAQYWGVAQRRRRVFVIGNLGDWRRAAAVLFERESLSRHPAPSREARERLADTLTVGVNQYSGFIGEPVEGAAVNHFVPIGNVQDGSITSLSSREYKGLSCGRDGMTSAAVIAFPAELSGTQSATTAELSPALSVGHKTAVTYGIPGNWIGRKPENGGNATKPMNDIAPNLTSADRHAVSTDMQVRRLTPRECERLQGFPDNFTRIPYRNKAAEDCPDGPRYKALGNSMAVPVMRWIGERIQMVEGIK